MTTDVILGGAIQQSSGIAGDTYYAHDLSTYASNRLGCWMQQRNPGDFNRWYGQLYIRGLCICYEAVQDDFGNLVVVQA